MSISDKEIEKKMQFFEKCCKENDLKITNQRIIIFRELASTEDHPDVEMIYNNVRKMLPAVSLDTVYRTLWVFSDIGLITPLGPKKQRIRFDANMEPHHHFICNECGLTRDIMEDSFKNLYIPKMVQKFGSIESSHIEFRGLCHKCEKERNILKRKKR